jgi:cell division transport system ATP-binding protein
MAGPARRTGRAGRVVAVLSTIVQFDEVGLRYGHGEEVLSDLTFSLATGEFYFLTGASGAGKTSLLRLLYLAQRPTRGRISLFGTEMVSLPRARMPGFRRRLGVVFQDFRLVPHLSVADNVALPLRIAGLLEDEVQEATSEMLAWVGLQHRAKARPETLSGGEQQRVAIARAVITRPDLLIADEPTGNVDEAMAERLLQLFASLNGIGTTVVIATHDMHLIARFGSAHLMRIEDGRLIDPTGALRHPPARSGAA